MGTITGITGLIQQEYSDLQDATILQTLIDDAYRKFLSRSQARNKAIAVPLTANTAEYDFPDTGIMKVHEVYYEASSDPVDWLQLKERSLDEFNVKRRGWRQTTGSSSSPTEYYITSAADGDSGKFQIGFYQVPGTSSSPTYPRCRMYTTCYAQISASESTPSELVSDEYFVAEVCRRWAQLRHAEDLGTWTSVSNTALSECVAHIKDMQSQSPDLQLIPMAYFGSRVR